MTDKALTSGTLVDACLANGGLTTGVPIGSYITGKFLGNSPLVDNPLASANLIDSGMAWSWSYGTNGLEPSRHHDSFSYVYRDRSGN